MLPDLRGQVQVERKLFAAWLDEGTHLCAQALMFHAADARARVKDRTPLRPPAKVKGKMESDEVDVEAEINSLKASKRAIDEEADKFDQSTSEAVDIIQSTAGKIRLETLFFEQVPHFARRLPIRRPMRLHDRDDIRLRLLDAVDLLRRVAIIPFDLQLAELRALLLHLLDRIRHLLLRLRDRDRELFLLELPKT